MRLKELNVEECLQDATVKQKYVNKVFETVAGSYDRFTRWGSWGMDARWKRAFLRMVEPVLPEGGKALDLACGTGDLAFALAGRMPQGNVLGMDICQPMIDLATHNCPPALAPRIAFQVGDMMALEMADRTFDLVSCGYGLRNVPDFRKALREIHRVLKPGGHFACLDMYRPANPLWRFLFLRVLLRSCQCYGWLYHREPASYAYLARSVEHFVTQAEMLAAYRETGFEMVQERRWLFGAVGVHLVRKSTEQSAIADQPREPGGVEA
jgi:demethylmenaquinone methyltransferase / 2-methoxy-6-polyprenyl-1,4-benzoquinol methylase